MPFGKRFRSGAYLNPDSEQEYAGPDYPDDDEEVTNYLSDILTQERHIGEMLNEMVNQGDKQVEFLSRLVTLFEGLSKGNIRPG
jgi:hypothetical protein